MPIPPTIARIVERLQGVLKSVGAFLRRAFEISRFILATYLHLVLYSRWRAVVLIISVVYVALLVTDLDVPGFSNTTMSATVRTEVMSFKIGRDEVLDWPLQAGSFTSFGPVDDFRCAKQDDDGFFYACEAPEGLSLHVENWAEVRMVVIPREELGNSASGPLLSIEVRPMEEPGEMPKRGDPRFGCVKPIGESEEIPLRPTSIELRSARGEVVYVSDGSFAFEIGNDIGWKVPLDVSNLLLGESLLSGVSWQPIVTAGEFRLFSSSGLAWWRQRSRYLVFEDTLDPADIVKIPQSGCWTRNRFVGFVSFEDSGVLDVIAHTGATDALVTRLGGQHAIRVSMWDILAGQPVWLAVLALFVWAVMILDYSKDDKKSRRTAEFIRDQKKTRRK